jgi:hypothetical protein
MSNYTVFTSIRLTHPDPDLLLHILRLVDLSAGAQIHEGFPLNIVVKTAHELSDAQIGRMQTAIDTCNELTPQSRAQTVIDQWPIDIQALVRVLIAQLNLLRAGLQVPLPPLVPADVLAAIRAKARML